MGFLQYIHNTILVGTLFFQLIYLFNIFSWACINIFFPLSRSEGFSLNLGGLGVEMPDVAFGFVASAAGNLWRPFLKPWLLQIRGF